MPRLLLLVILWTVSLSLRAQDTPTLYLYCDPAQPRIEMAMVPVPDAIPGPSASQPERIDVAALVVYGPEDGKGNVHRTGSTSTTRRCGRLRIRVSGAFFNANTQGELGAADDYPVVELFDGEERLAVPLALGVCDVSNGRYSGTVDCPGNWASHISVFFNRDSAVVYLRHEYEEYREPVSPATTVRANPSIR